MDSITMTKTRSASARTVAPACAAVGAEGRRLQAPDVAVHGTGLPIAGTSQRVSGELAGLTYGAGVFAGSAAFAGVRTTDLPVSPPRGAPV